MLLSLQLILCFCRNNPLKYKAIFCYQVKLAQLQQHQQHQQLQQQQQQQQQLQQLSSGQGQTSQQTQSAQQTQSTAPSQQLVGVGSTVDGNLVNSFRTSDQVRFSILSHSHELDRKNYHNQKFLCRHISVWNTYNTTNITPNKCFILSSF